jgi:hypothetical protein
MPESLMPLIRGRVTLRTMRLCVAPAFPFGQINPQYTAVFIKPVLTTDEHGWAQIGRRPAPRADRLQKVSGIPCKNPTDD